MKANAMFSIGDYEIDDNLDNLIYFRRGSDNQRRKKGAPMQPQTNTKRPQVGQQRAGVAPAPQPKVRKGINAARQNLINESTGVRKGHIRNIGGKAVMVGQSILKAGKNTAGQLAAVAKNNPRLAIASGVGAAALGGGGVYMSTRKKRDRR